MSTFFVIVQALHVICTSVLPYIRYALGRQWKCRIDFLCQLHRQHSVINFLRVNYTVLLTVVVDSDCCLLVLLVLLSQGLKTPDLLNTCMSKDIVKKNLHNVCVDFNALFQF